MAIEAARLLIRVGADVSDAEAGLNKVGRSITQMASSTARTLGIAGAGMTAALTAPLVALGSQALSSAADFEQSMNILASVADIPAQSLEHLQRQALNLGAQTSFSAGEAAEAMLELGKAGMDMFEISASIGGVLDLAAAGGIGLADAAAVTSAALNTFGLEASESARVANLLAGAANASAADMSDLALSATQAGQGFALTNQPVEDMVTSIALLANVGQTGSKAGTNLNQAMQRLINPTVKAKKQMKALGIEVFDSSGEMLSMTEIIDEFNAGLAGMTTEQQAAVLSTVFLTDGMQAMVPLLEAGSAGFREMREQVTQEGQAADAAAARMSGLSGAMEYLSGSVDSFLIGAALPFLDFVGQMVRGVADAITGIGNLPDPVKNAALAFAGVLAAAGPIIGVLAAVAGAFALLGTAAAPILLVTAAVAGLAAAIAGNFGGIRDRVAAAIAPLQEFGAELLSILQTGQGTADLGPLSIKVTPEYTTIQVGDLIEGIWTPEYATIDVANIITGIWTPEYKRISIKDIFTGTWTPDFTKIEIGKAFALTLTSEGPITVQLGAEQFTFDLSAAISTMQIKIAAFAGEVRAAWMTEGWSGLGALAAEKIGAIRQSIIDALTPDVPTAEVLREGAPPTALQTSWQVWRDQMLAEMTTTIETFDFTKTAVGILAGLSIALETGDYSGVGAALGTGLKRSFASGAAAAAIAGIGLELVNAIIPSVGPAIRGISWVISSSNFSGFRTAVIDAFTGINWVGIRLAATNLELAINTAFGRFLGGMITGVTGWKQPQWLADLFAWEPSTPEWIQSLLDWSPATPEWIQSLLDWSPSMPAWVESLLGWQPPSAEGPAIGAGSKRDSMRVPPGDIFGPFGVPRPSPGAEFDFPLKAMVTEVEPSATLKPLQIKGIMTELTDDTTTGKMGDTLSKGAATIGSTLSGFSWPALPVFEFPALPPFSWPAYPTWTWPPIDRPLWLNDLRVPRPDWLGTLLSWSPEIVIRAPQAITTPGQITTAAPAATASMSAASVGEGEIGAASVGAAGVSIGPVYVNSELDIEALAYRVTQLQNQRG